MYLGTDVYFGGSFTKVGGITSQFFAKWSTTTSTWSTFNTTVNSTVIALKVIGNFFFNYIFIQNKIGSDIYVGGLFTSPGNYIAKWNTANSVWIPLGSGTDNFVNSIDLLGDEVIVGGSFTSAGGLSVRGLAKWNITTSSWAKTIRVSGTVATMLNTGN